MKIQLKYLASLLGAAALCMTSCNDDEGEIVDMPFFDDEELVINKPAAAAQCYKFSVSASETVEWSAAIDGVSDWIELVDFSGTGNGVVTYSVDENIGLEMRSAGIIITAKDIMTDFSSSKRVLIRQIGSAPALLITPSGEKEMPAEPEEDLIVEITSNLKWQASLDFKGEASGWARLLTADSGENDGILKITFDKNESPEYRYVELTVSNPDYPELTTKLLISQQYADMKYTIALKGLFDVIPSGEYLMELSSEEGDMDPVKVTVYYTDEGAVLEYSLLLLPGDYTVKSVFTEDGTLSYTIEAPFTMGENGIVSDIADYDSALGKFGGSEKWPFALSAYDDLVALKDAVASGNQFSGKFFAQTADIDMNAESWPGIGSANIPFAGIYDGKGHSINNLFIHVSDNTGHGFFNYVKGVSKEMTASVRNLVLNGRGGDDYDVITEDSYIGSCIGRLGSFTYIYECHNYANVRCIGKATGSQKTGGLIGNAEGEAVLIENCSNHGLVTTTNSSCNMQDCGGFLGNAKGTSSSDKIVLKGCRNYGDCSFDGNSGGLIGNLDECTDVIRCANFGNVKNTKASMRVGCLIGSIDVGSPITVTECFNLGNFDGLVNSGGLIGFAKGAFVISNCYSRGDFAVNGNNSNNGGVLGHKNTTDGEVLNCYCAADYKPKGSGAKAGAVVGMNAAANVKGVQGCWYESGRGFTMGVSLNSDSSGVAEGKDASWFKSGQKIDGWDDTVWKFEDGKYPTLVNNPEN
ncbi:MAG: BACON domain-containing protein [Candidatus Cryptobacteroides sp.]